MSPCYGTANSPVAEEVVDVRMADQSMASGGQKL